MSDKFSCEKKVDILLEKEFEKRWGNLKYQGINEVQKPATQGSTSASKNYIPPRQKSTKGRSNLQTRGPFPIRIFLYSYLMGHVPLNSCKEYEMILSSFIPDTLDFFVFYNNRFEHYYKQDFI